jgi:myo-inositol-1(or 4)-monophosphatase
MRDLQSIPQKAKVAEHAASVAGRILRKYVDQSLQVSYKRKDDPVTRADTEAENAIKTIIERQFPNDSLVGEESGETIKSSDFQWVIDPLDGTKSFLENKAGFAVSICVVKAGAPIVGVVYDVIGDNMYTAIRDKGLFVNGKKMHLGTCKGKLLALRNNAEPFKSAIEDILPSLGVLSVFFTSTALALALVAEGKALGVLKLSYTPWDIAAGCLLVEEAGGVVTDCFGKKLDFLSPTLRNNNGCFAASKELHTKILPIIRKQRTVMKLI